ncbi:YeeE/YedE family protein [Sphingobacterium sp. SYP-B4668]|uniref:YeeE/YedE family protein n=1 Tax=Sphingobacterium sp. SYP-B4668 TaxID=2996035 RepID=UPI0022DE1C59|nr:YeeE/YedE thiosulfate transporter family protein [Sphingobacterium sp. SYP-B4668]
MELIYGPWPWYIGGPLVAFSMIALILLGKNFGVSANFRTMCSILGAGKTSDFFRFEWKSQIWNLLILGGAVIGGYIGAHLLSNGQQVPDISPDTIAHLQGLGFASAGQAYAPSELYQDLTIKSLGLLLFGGILVGFGTRYAGGCTSGHAISGLSDLQLPSLIAVIGFFIGGLVMVHLLFPFIF